MFLVDRMKQMSRQVGETKKVKDLYEILDRTENKKVEKTLGKYLRKLESSVDKTFFNTLESKQMQNVKRPFVISEELVYVDKDEDKFYIGHDPVEKDKYKDLFKVAFSNVRREINLTKIVEEVEKNYIQNEMEELELTEEYWDSQDFKTYLKTIEEKQPEKLQAYKREQIKKIEAIRKLKETYEDVELNRRELDNIEKAIRKLDESKSILPEKIYQKCEKSLLKQNSKEKKKEEKLKKKKDKILSRTSLIQSINNAKEHKRKIEKLKAIANPQELENMLKNMQIKLVEAERLWKEAKGENQFIVTDNDVVLVNGEVREIGDRVSGYNTNSTAIAEAKTKVENLKIEIANQTERNRQLTEERKTIEEAISYIHVREVEDTIKGEKASTVVLPEGEQSVKSENKIGVPKVTVDHKKAIEKVNINDENILIAEDKEI